MSASPLIKSTPAALANFVVYPVFSADEGATWNVGDDFLVRGSQNSSRASHEQFQH